MTVLDESTVRGVCRELLAQPGRPSGRALRRELKSRYQVAGKTQRVFAIWREERQAVLDAQWRQRLNDAESELQQLRDRVAALMAEVTVLRARVQD